MNVNVGSVLGPDGNAMHVFHKLSEGRVYTVVNVLSVSFTGGCVAELGQESLIELVECGLVVGGLEIRNT